MEWGGRENQEGGMYVHLWLIHVVHQKATQHCNVNYPSSKKKSFKLRENRVIWFTEEYIIQVKYPFPCPEGVISLIKDHLNVLFDLQDNIPAKCILRKQQKIVNTEITLSHDAIAHVPNLIWKQATSTMKFSQRSWGYEATNLVGFRNLQDVRSQW